MDPIAHHAERALRRSPHPALRLSELLDSVSECLDRSLDARRLRGILERHPERFRIFEPWRGRWSPAAGALLAKEGDVDAWVVAVGDPDDPPDGAGPVAVARRGASDVEDRLRESVRWLARAIDARATDEVSRWCALAASERRIRSDLTRRAA
jgi:hypothetical protein